MREGEQTAAAAFPESEFSGRFKNYHSVLFACGDWLGHGLGAVVIYKYGFELRRAIIEVFILLLGIREFNWLAVLLGRMRASLRGETKRIFLGMIDMGGGA